MAASCEENHCLEQRNITSYHFSTLRGWESKTKRIHRYDLKTGRTQHDVGIKGQGQRNQFYEDNEDTLASFDAKSSKVCQIIRNTQSLVKLLQQPELLPNLYAFLIIQNGRVPTAANDYKEFIEGGAEILLDSLPDKPPGKITVTQRFPQLNSTRLAAEVQLRYMDDLTPHLIIAEEGSFLTSDNPVFLYNQFNQGITWATSAVDSHGFQAFFPISPKIVLMLYDPQVYEIADTKAASQLRSKATAQDIIQLNQMQLLNAEQNIYAKTKRTIETVPQEITSVEPLRANKEPTRDIFQKIRKKGRTIITFSRSMPDLDLNLSYIHPKAAALNMPIQWRVYHYRHP